MPEASASDRACTKERTSGNKTGKAEHKVYLELFAGSLAVLLNKQRSHIETVNDRHGEVVNYFRVLRDQREKLKQAIEMTPYSRQEYNDSYVDTEDEIERARRF